MVISTLGIVLSLQGSSAHWSEFPVSSVPRCEWTGLITSEITCWDTLNSQQIKGLRSSCCGGLAQEVWPLVCLQLEEILVICGPPAECKWESSRNRAMKSQRFLTRI